MKGLASVLRAGLLRGRFPLGSMFCRLGVCGRVLVVSSIAHCRGGMCFVVTLRGLLFLFFLRGRFLDPAELSQNFFSLLRGLPAAGELHGEHLYDNLVELCSTRHTKRFELRGYNRKSDTNRAPLVQKGTNLRKGGRSIGLGHQVRDLIERKFLEKPESIDRSIHLAPNELLLDLQRFFLKTERGFRFGGTEAGL